jgi:hypothetical protein
MKYTIILPAYEYDSIGKVFEITDFADLMKFARHATSKGIIKDLFDYKNIESLLDSELFVKSSIQDDHYVYHHCLYESYCGNVHDWEGFLSVDYVYSNTHELFIHRDDAEFIHCTNDWVSNDYAHIHYFCHEDGYFYTYPEENDGDQWVSEYHSESSEYFEGFDFDDYEGYSVGIEFEKEDIDAKQSIDIHDFSRNYRQWRKEKDASLDDDSGFELISPIYPLIPELIVNDIKSNSVIRDHVNAEVSPSCGGHMNLSCDRYTPEVLFDRAKWYLPLLYAMYPNRRYVTYCEKKKIIGNEESYQRKYSPIAIKSNRIEFRIFSAIKNVNQLEFRLKLLKMIAENKVSTFSQVHDIVMKNKDLFLSVYSEDQFQRMISRLLNEISEELSNVA